MNKNDNIIGILGCGVIGSAIYKAFKNKKFKVIGHDKKFQTKLKDLLSSKIIFVCLPTPINKSGASDLSILKREINKLSILKYTGIVCIKSTVPPGTSKSLKQKYKKMRIINCPEFLRERYAYKDFVNYGLCIIGSDYKNNKDIKFVKSLHKPFTKEFKVVTLTEAELIKYFHNTYNALRVVFANSFFDLTKFYSSNYDKVLEMVCLRNGITNKYLQCSKNIRGFAGYCLPKDTSSLSSIVKKNKLNLNIWKFILEENNKFKKTVFPGMRK